MGLLVFKKEEPQKTNDTAREDYQEGNAEEVLSVD